jgi:hypothetical protein
MLQQIQELLDRDPFVPFQVVMTSEDKYVVTSPHMLLLGKTLVFYCFPRSDRLAWLRYNQVAAVELVNGKHGSRRARF